jgi:hypothetical protein
MRNRSPFFIGKLCEPLCLRVLVVKNKFYV